MADWTVFAGASGLLLLAVIVLTRQSARELARIERTRSQSNRGGAGIEAGEAGRETVDHEPRPGPTGLLAGVAASHGLFLAGLVGVVAWTGVPVGALGVGAPSAVTAALGVGLGIGVYGLSELGERLAERAGLDRGTRIEELLAPAGPGGWALLVLLVLPVVAAFEELLFRGVLVGGLAAGFGLPLPALVVGSSAVFALGHGAQGRAGVLVAGAIGFVLGTAFVRSGSLALVVVAHYVTNALAFARAGR